MNKIDLDRRLRVNLIRLRQRAGLTQISLASKSGVSNIAQIEAGTRPAGKQALVKLAKALDIDVYEFFLPNDTRVVRNDTERVFLNMIDSCSKKGREFIMDTITNFLEYEKIS